MGSSLQDFVCVDILLAVMFDFIYRRYDCYLRFYSSVLPLKLKKYGWPSVFIIFIIMIFAKLIEMCPEVYLNILCLLLQSISHEVCSHLQFFIHTPVFKKRPNFLNSAPTSIEGAIRLLSAPSGRFWQQTAICPISLSALVVELHSLNWARAQAVSRTNVSKKSRTHRGKIATYLTAEYHHGRLQSTHLAKLRIDASA